MTPLEAYPLIQLEEPFAKATSATLLGTLILIYHAMTFNDIFKGYWSKGEVADTILLCKLWFPDGTDGTKGTNKDGDGVAKGSSLFQEVF